MSSCRSDEDQGTPGSPDARQALVVQGDWQVNVVEIAPLLERVIRPPSKLARLATLASGQRIELRDVAGMTTDQWLERWRAGPSTGSQTGGMHVGHP